MTAAPRTLTPEAAAALMFFSAREGGLDLLDAQTCAALWLAALRTQVPAEKAALVAAMERLTLEVSQ